MTKYFGPPRWRYLVLPLLFFPTLFLAAFVTLLSIGTIRGIRIWHDAMEWAMYE